MTILHFNPHGECSFEVADAHVLLLHTRGPWNLEHVQMGHAFALREIAKFEGRPWWLLGYLHGEGVHTPDARREQIQSIQIQKTLGRQGTAFIVVENSRPGFFIDMFRRIYKEAGETMEVFEDEASARAWIAEQINLLRAERN